MRWQEGLALGHGWWRQKTPRDRALLMAAGAALALAVWWSFVWLPIGRAREAGFVSLERTAAARAAIASVPAGAEGMRTSEALRTTVTQSAADAGIVILQIERREEAIALTLAPVAFDKLVAWLADVSGQHGIRVARADLARAPQPGVVSAELVMAGP